MTDDPPPGDLDLRAPQPVTILRRLLAVADGRTTHVWNGSCPESENGHRDSDPTCPACAVLNEAQAFLAGFACAVCLTTS